MSERGTTIRLETILDAPADNVWAAMKHPVSFLYVTWGLVGAPGLVGRTDPFVQGETDVGWLFLFHLFPLWNHTVDVLLVDDETRTFRTREYGGLLRSWDHTLHVEPIDAERSLYVDGGHLDAGVATPLMARVVTSVYHYRLWRWHRLARKHLSITREPREAGHAGP